MNADNADCKTINADRRCGTLVVMSESSQRPRSPRVPVEFALDVEGTDAAGKSFQAKAKATKISRGGATLLIDVDVPVGSTVQLVAPFGGKLTAEVNGSWIDDIDGNRRIGVKLLDANGWFAE